ncbi:MAG: 7-carboxy-7-deazaguanine synthase QueE [Candidatus Omnitrophica bacterium]|nr:7-carboxy-7-deazaguanine synthase QueE [Candidatus Omnitrophota bacterium]
MLTAKISEIFYSIQGEGIYLGTGHLFIRFFGCNIKCAYCDTDKNKFKQYSVKELTVAVDKLVKKHKVKYISLTGGEPLLQTEFVEMFLKKLKLDKLKIYLETNGLLCSDFLRIKKYIDIVAMDFKIPSATGLAAFWAEHQRFLKAAKNKKVFVKAVVGLKTKAAEIKKAAKIIAAVDKDIVLVLQPVAKQLSAKLIKKTMLWQAAAQQDLTDVRIIPQVHKLIGVR